MYLEKQCPNQRHMGMLWQCTVSAEIVDIVECKVHVYVYICMALMKEPYHTVIWVMELGVKVYTLASLHDWCIGCALYRQRHNVPCEDEEDALCRACSH